MDAQSNAMQNAIRRGPDLDRPLSKLFAQVNGRTRFAAIAIEVARLQRQLDHVNLLPPSTASASMDELRSSEAELQQPNSGP